MTIIVRRPVEGKRQSITEGDEAKISRIISTPERRYQGMVERIQEINERDTGQPARLFLSLRGTKKALMEFQYYPCQLEMHMLRHIATRLAKILYPKNFINYRELRFFNDGDATFAANYSDFVSDENGALKRVEDLRKRIRGTVRNESAKHMILGQIYAMTAMSRMIATGNKAEDRRNPELIEVSDAMMKEGIHVAHPQLNYHVSNGRTVFMEVGGVDLVKSLAACQSRNKTVRTRALVHISALYSHLLRYGYVCTWEENSRTVAVKDFHGIVNAADEIGFLSGDFFSLSRIFEAVFRFANNKGKLPTPKETFVECACLFREKTPLSRSRIHALGNLDPGDVWGQLDNLH